MAYGTSEKYVPYEAAVTQINHAYHHHLNSLRMYTILHIHRCNELWPNTKAHIYTYMVGIVNNRSKKNVDMTIHIPHILSGVDCLLNTLEGHIIGTHNSKKYKYPPPRGLLLSYLCFYS